MKSFTRVALITSLFLFSTSLSAFSQDYMDAIAKNSCACIDNLVANSETKNLEIRLGLCMLEAAKPYEKQIKRDYNIELSRIDEQGEELGKVMGVRIATQCPNAFIALTIMLEEDKQPVSVENSFVGEIISVSDQQFVVFTLKDATGKTTNFFWLTFFPSDVNLAGDYKKLLKKKVRLNYTEQEYFDPRIKEYKKYNVITSLNAAN